MQQLTNYVTGSWLSGNPNRATPLHHAITGETIFSASTEGIDMQAVLRYARNTGNIALRKMSFHDRGRMLKALALYLLERKEKYYQLSFATGATRADSWIDIEGGIGNLFAYASLRKKFPDLPYTTDGEVHTLSKQGSFLGHHLLLPKEGSAIHINAYNFPIWGMLEKCAVNWLAGVPAVVKPATITSFLTHAVVKDMIGSNLLPEGALQLICGSAGDLLDHVTSQDVVTFTGSAQTGLQLRNQASIIRNGVPFTMEADSLNCIVLGEDVQPGSIDWDIFLKEIRKEMTVKCGQKCTAIRRIIVPKHLLEATIENLSAQLQQTTIGNPSHEKVRMGALAGIRQREEVITQVSTLLTENKIVYGSLSHPEVMDADGTIGAFLSPILLLNEAPFTNRLTHEVEAFGPVSTVMPYTDLEEAIALSKMGMGSLVTTIVTSSPSIATRYVVEAGVWHGRVLVLNAACAKESTGHGSPLPLLVHGGPGRAGGGEEMGGVRGVKHYMQRVALQGSPDMLTAITQQYQAGAKGITPKKHPFLHYYEELEVGMQIISETRTITQQDIESFAALSGDQFYAHQANADFSDTLFEKQVAHGYFIMSAAAGLFVPPYIKNPVLLNYGIDSLRFTEPVYPGDTLTIRFTCKEKIPQDQREDTDIPKGIVKWYVEMLNHEQAIAGIATILTMVKKQHP